LRFKSGHLLVVLTILCVPSSCQTVQQWFDEGKVFCDQGRYGEAIEAFDKSIELNDPRLEE